MSVVGFDIGNLNSFISVARQGGIEVVTNDYSLHATPSVVQFGDKCRTMGVPAKNSMMSNLRNTIFNFKNLIGRKYSDPVVQDELPYLPFQVSKLANDVIGVKVDFLGESRVFTMEQVTAILLLKLKESAEAFMKTKVYDCVIAVPSFWTDTQRRAMLDASKIAELNCLRIINETTAVALAYGIYKQDLPEEKEKARLVAFVDIGHTASQASIVAFNKGKLKVLGTSYDLGFGGRALDRFLREYFTAEFKSKYKVDAASKPRPNQRLLDECEKVKKLMSANMQALPLNIECFMDDKDVSAKISRAEFEEMSDSLFPRFTNMLNDLFTKTKIRKEDLYSVEIVGGSSRVPRVKTMIRDVFGKEPSTTLNLDEAVSRGAALQCAMLSPTFRVREFSITDAQPYAIKVVWDSTCDADQGETIVFDENDAFPFSKMISFYRKEPFTLKAYYNAPNCIPYPTTHIGSFDIHNVVPDPEGNSSRVKVKVRVNPNGLFLVSSASMYEKKVTQDEEAKMEQEAAEQPEQPAAQENGNVDDKGDTNMESGQEPPAAAAGAPDDKPAAPEGEEKKDDKAKPAPKAKVKSIDLPIQETVPQFGAAELGRLVEQERAMRKSDREEKEKADLRNSLETYVYEMRDRLSDGGNLHKFANPQEGETLLGQLSSTEDWIYDEGEDVAKQVYLDRLNDLKKMGDPIIERQVEFEIRGPEWRDIRATIVRTRKFVQEFMAGDEKYNHLDAADVEKVRKCLEEKEAWCDKNEGAQNARDLTLAPIVFASQIRSEREALERVVRPVQNKTKPKVEPPPPAPEEKTDEAAAAQETDAPAAAATDSSETGPSEAEAATMEVD